MADKPTLSGAQSKKGDDPDGMYFFRHLCWVEGLTVWALAICIVGLCAHFAIWVVSGKQNFIHARLVATLGQVDKGWKIALLVMIPLFFRPIYKFLINLRKGPLGTESGLPSSPIKSQGYKKAD